MREKRPLDDSDRLDAATRSLNAAIASGRARRHSRAPRRPRLDAARRKLRLAELETGLLADRAEVRLEPERSRRVRDDITVPLSHGGGNAEEWINVIARKRATRPRTNRLKQQLRKAEADLAKTKPGASLNYVQSV